MSILIKGMEMPKSCEDCHLESFCSLWIEARRICKWSPDNREAFIRHPDCPLVPVPPHGRLIEDVAVREQIDEWLDSVGYVVVGRGLSYYGELLGCIKDAPTIIPASEEGE